LIQYAYLFEVRGIQRFLFASGKLRDMLGGSELLDYLCADDGLLDQTLKSLDLQPKIVRKAGGSFYLLFERREDAVRLRAVWRLACGNWLPGVEQIDALSEGRSAREAMDEGLRLLRKARNRLCADLPRPGPLSERSPRTGLAAVLRERDESLDAATARQRRFERPKDQDLAQRFLDEDDYLWPINFEEDAPASERFPLGERHLVGLLHADGNGLGELLRVLTDACKDADDATYIDLYRGFSDGLSDTTLAAARQACRVLRPHACDKVLPARPLVLGGDDLTILVRADLALPFAKAFLDAFESHSRSAMTRLNKVFADKGLQAQASRLPAHLTACAGLCYMKCSHPFQAGQSYRPDIPHRKMSFTFMNLHAPCSQPQKVCSFLAFWASHEDRSDAADAGVCFDLRSAQPSAHAARSGRTPDGRGVRGAQRGGRLCGHRGVGQVETRLAAGLHEA